MRDKYSLTLASSCIGKDVACTDVSNVKKNSDDNDEKSFESTHSTMGI